MIRLDMHGAVAVVSIDRPEQRNALDAEHCRGLIDHTDRAVGDGARCVVVTGVGSAFCAGADFGSVYGDEFRYALIDLMKRMASQPVPVLAAINGPAIGAGCQLAVATDLRVSVPEAVFGVPTAKLGLAADPWSVRRAVQVLGDPVARTLLLGCSRLSAGYLHGTGFIDRLGGFDEALRWAEEIAELAPLTLSYYRMALDSQADPSITAHELTAAFERCWASEDQAEGQRARAEKRPPRFRGR